MSRPLDTAPDLPAGSVDFNKFHQLVAKGDASAAEKAVIKPAADEPPAPPTAPAAE